MLSLAANHLPGACRSTPRARTAPCYDFACPVPRTIPLPDTICVPRRTQRGRMPGAHGPSPSCWSLAISDGRVTSSVTPVTMTLHPERVFASISSISNDARADRTTAWNLVPSFVLKTTDCDGESNAKFTGRIIGRSPEATATTLPTRVAASSERHSDRVSSTSRDARSGVPGACAGVSRLSPSPASTSAWVNRDSCESALMTSRVHRCWATQHLPDVGAPVGLL